MCLFEYSTSIEERKEVQEPISHDEDGEPDQWKIIGFETV